MNSGSTTLNKLLGWIPNWVGFGIIIILALVAIIFGVRAPSVGLIAFGGAVIISSILVWFTGNSSSPDVFTGSFGATLSNLKTWVWFVLFGLFVVVIIIALIAH